MTAPDRTRFATAKFRWLNAVAMDINVGPLAVRIAVLLGDRARAETGITWRSQEQLAGWCGITSRAVRTSISALQDAKHLEVIRQGKRQVNRYRLMLDGTPVTGSWLPVGDRNETSTHPPSDRKESSSTTGSSVPPTSFSYRSSGPNGPEKGIALSRSRSLHRASANAQRKERRPSTAELVVAAGWLTEEGE